MRQGNDDAIFRATGLGAGTVKLSKVSWFIPRVQVNDQERLRLMKTIEAKSTVEAGFRVHMCDTVTVPRSTTWSWKMTTRTSPECPRWVIVAFQTNRLSQQDKNAAVFDHCNAEDVWVELNGQAYPALKRNTDFGRQQIALIYNAIGEFLPNYYGIIYGHPNISPVDFRDLYPLHVINISKQPERVKYGVMDMTLKGKFRTAVEANTQAFALIISDRILTFQSDGSKMNVTI